MAFPSPLATISIPAIDIAGFTLEHAIGRGERIALIDADSGESLTFGQLAADVTRVAGGLSAAGIAQRDVVAIVAPNSIAYAVAFLATNTLGAAVTTANPTYTERELNAQFRDSGARAVFTTDRDLEKVERARANTTISTIVTLDDGGRAIDMTSLRTQSAPLSVTSRPTISPEDLAVLPYSSGTTGVPKGVMLTHRNLVANLIQIDAMKNVDDGDVMLGLLPFFHIFGMVAGLLYAVRTGATLVILSRYDLSAMLTAMERYQITMANLVPPILLSLANDPDVDPKALKLRTILSGAAPLSAELANRVATRLGCRVAQGYGLTETSPVTHCPIGGKEPAGSSGYTVPNTTIRIVDPTTGEPLGLGEDGEIHIHGPQVMAGYLGQPEATRNAIDADGYFHTGDIGHVTEDGAIYVVDRLKELIKVNGMQVAPAELEAVLLEHDAIRDAAVIGAEDERCGEVPRAFVVLKRPVSTKDIQDFVAARVAPHKRVRIVQEVDSIPKSASGKILRRELRTQFD